MKKFLFLGILALAALVGCQSNTAQPTTQNTSDESTSLAGDENQHTTLKPVITDDDLTSDDLSEDDDLTLSAPTTSEFEEDLTTDSRDTDESSDDDLLLEDSSESDSSTDFDN